MPTYQYSCTECGHFLEIFQSFSDDSLTVCPECEGRLRKVFNAVGVVFKGSGFYRNDSRSTEKSDTSEKSDTGDSSGTSDKKDKKSAEPSTGPSEKSEKKTEKKKSEPSAAGAS